MQLLLTSIGLTNKKITDNLLAMLPKKPKDCSVLVVAFTRNEREELFRDETRKILKKLGFGSVSDFNLTDKKFSGKQKFDVVYVCGGNTFYILDRMRKTGIDEFIKKSVLDEDAVYVGASAGSIIAGPDIAIAGWGSTGGENDIKLKDLTGLEFVDFTVYPHYESKLKKEVEAFRQSVSCHVIEITDDQAVYADDLGYRMIK